VIRRIFAIGGQPLQIVAGPRYYASHFENGARGCGARLNLILLFPQ